MSKIEEVKKEYQEILQQLSDPELISDWEKFEDLNKRRMLIEKIIEKEGELKDIRNRIEENKSIISAGEDSELASLAETEITQLQEKEKVVEKEIYSLLQPNKTKSEGNMAVIVEIRAGTRGAEASLFAGDLFRMYSKYGVSIGWQQKILDSHPAELGGFKEIVFELKLRVETKDLHNPKHVLF